MVGSLYESPAQFGACVVLTGRGEHVVANTELYRDALKHRLIQFYKRTQKKPEHILVYRSGVTEALFKRVSQKVIFLTCLAAITV